MSAPITDSSDISDWKKSSLIYCEKFYTNPDTTNTIISVTIIVAVIGVNFVAMIRIFTRRKKFSVRQRAPLLAILHVSFYTLAIILCLVYELLKAEGYVDWSIDAKNSHEVPESRKIPKFLMVFVRNGLNYMIIFR